MISSYSYDVEFSNQLCVYKWELTNMPNALFLFLFFFNVKFYYLTNLNCKLNYIEHFY